VRRVGAPHGVGQGVNTIFPRNPPRSRLVYASRKRDHELSRHIAAAGVHRGLSDWSDLADIAASESVQAG
jgi:hypothetical protein